jgi:hypothetical protein
LKFFLLKTRDEGRFLIMATPIIEIVTAEAKTTNGGTFLYTGQWDRKFQCINLDSVRCFFAEKGELLESWNAPDLNALFKIAEYLKNIRDKQLVIRNGDGKLTEEFNRIF